MTTTRRFAALPAGRVTKWMVLVLWLIVIGVAGSFAGKLSAVQKNDAAAYLPGGAESLSVAAAQQKFPGSDLAPAIVVYERSSGITAGDRALVGRQTKSLLTKEFAKGKVVGPIPARDGKALQLLVPVDVHDGADIVGEVKGVRDVVGADNSLTGQVTGPAGLAADQLEVFNGIDGTLLYASLGVVILILLLVYRSPFLWFVPLATAGIALATGQGVNYLLAKYAGITVNGQSAGILTVLVIGAGTDYALLLIARYREELRRHEDRHEAMAAALHRAGPAIIASAGTVILGLLCLLLAELNSTSGLGPVAAVGIASALLAMTTLLPAVLVILGRWVFWPFVPRYGSPDAHHQGVWARLGSGVGRRPRLVWTVTAAALAVLCLGLFSYHAKSLNYAESFSSKPESITGQATLARHFDAGTGSPATIIGRADASAQVVRAARAVPGVSSVQPVGVHQGLVEIDAALADAPDSAAAYATIDRLRTAVHSVPGAQAKVGGPSAIAVDTNRAVSHDNRLIIPVVLLVVLLVLGLLLRSIAAPVVLIATVALSFLASLGVTAFAFDHLFGFAGEDNAFLLFAFIFLVALGIDYNIFLMTRVREESARHGTGEGVVRAVAATGGVITSAGVVLAATFATLGVLPLVVFIEVGVTVAFGVLLDTLVVRSILVPALTVDVGRLIWWPSRLSRVTAWAGAPESREPASVPAS